jgi:hypothetical protein
MQHFPHRKYCPEMAGLETEAETPTGEEANHPQAISDSPSSPFPSAGPSWHFSKSSGIP